VGYVITAHDRIETCIQTELATAFGPVNYKFNMNESFYQHFNRKWDDHSHLEFECFNAKEKTEANPVLLEEINGQAINCI